MIGDYLALRLLLPHRRLLLLDKRINILMVAGLLIEGSLLLFFNVDVSPPLVHFFFCKKGVLVE